MALSQYYSINANENFAIDWVVLFDFQKIEPLEAIAEYRSVIHELESIGLQTEVRRGYGCSLLVFIKVPRTLLGNEVYRSRVKDWLFGITHARPIGANHTVVDAETPAEEIRSIFHIVTWQKDHGGAGITGDSDKWNCVKASFPLHVPTANSELLHRLNRETILKREDLDNIRALFGESVAFYYAFIQCYSLFLLFPAGCGIMFWLFDSPYSISLAALNCLWCIVFVEYWKKQETDLGIRWGVKGVGSLKVNRMKYKWEKEVTDPTTGEVKKVFPASKRLLRQLLFVPFAAIAALALGTLIGFTFTLEVLISEVYQGVFEGYLQFVPTILFALSLPRFDGFLTSIAERLTTYENYRTQDEHEHAKTQKLFVLNFITSFLPTLLNAYIYVPYGARMLQILHARDIFGTRLLSMDSGQPSHDVRRIDPSRLQQEVIYLTITGQVINFGEEVVLPYIKRGLRHFYLNRKLRSSTAALHRRRTSEFTSLSFIDSPAEAGFLKRVRDESDAEVYNVQDDIVEMCVQFGYLALFGVVWPLVPLGFLLNNWVELRGDLFKLTRECQRPPPIRSDSIGHSLQALEFLTWLGTLSTAALLHMYRGDVREMSLSSLIITVFITEQLYHVARLAVRTGFARIGSEAVRQEEARRYMVRKRYLETFSEEVAQQLPQQQAKAPGWTREESHRPVEQKGTCDVELEQTLPDTPSPQMIRPNVEPSNELDITEDFWRSKHSGISTTEVGVKLILAITAALGHNKANEPVAGKSKNF